MTDTGTQLCLFDVGEPEDNDEIDKALRYGSGFSGGKLRIYAFYRREPDAGKRIEFLKREYGEGGCTHYFRDGSIGCADHNSKGISLLKFGSDWERHLTWAQVNRRLAGLIERGEYLTDKEQWEVEATP